MRLKLRFLAGGTIVFLLGLVLSAIRGFGTGYAVLIGIGIVLLVLGLFWKDKPRAKNEDQQATS